MWKVFQWAGNLFRSLSGWAYVMGLIPGILTFVSSSYESWAWPERIAYTTGAFAAGLLVAYLGIKIVLEVSSYSTSRLDQKRIARAIKEMIEGNIDEIDTQTAAQIWSGASEDVAMTRLRFRIIKRAIDNREIPTPRFRDRRPGASNDRANIYTWMPTSELRDFFVLKRVLNPKDL